MAQNVGVLESVLRVAVGFTLLFVAFIAPASAKWLAYAGFVVFAVSGFTGKCLLYRILGISTCREE
jgi:hypothetical protein